MFARIAALIACGLLAGCATSSNPYGNYAGEDAGYAILALGAAKPVHFSSQSLHYRPLRTNGLDSGEGLFLFASPLLRNAKGTDFDTEEEQGVVVIAALPPGEYEIFATTVFENYGTVQTTFRSTRPFSIPFTIHPGEAVYLGSFRSRRLTGKNVFGMEVTAGAAFEISDSMARDLGLARTRTGQLPAEIVQAVPDPDLIGSPIFTRGVRGTR